MRTATQPRISKMAGFSYVEVLISVVLIAIVLVPAMEALQPGMAASGIHEIIAEDHYRLTGKMEEVLAEPFADLDIAAITAGSATTATAYSDVFTYPNGRQINRNVFIAQYDGDNADSDNDPSTGTDTGLLWVQVEIAGTALSLETLVSE
jgi:type II secretory pathway component PulJ